MKEWLIVPGLVICVVGAFVLFLWLPFWLRDKIQSNKNLEAGNPPSLTAKARLKRRASAKS
jgi:hypothetical protein